MGTFDPNFDPEITLWPEDDPSETGLGEHTSFPENTQIPLKPGSVVTGPRLLAVLCSAGHINRVEAQFCAQCGGPLQDEPCWVPRPVLGELVFPGEYRVPVQIDLVIGRDPRAVEDSRPAPALVKVHSPNNEVSRSHCRIQVDNWQVRVVDLGTKNGSLLVKSGLKPTALVAFTPVLLHDGDQLILGDGVSCYYKEVL
ncbi:hypothetical protein BSR29_01625 [Boudabousia liubingyangii]|uniref:FHA domain-containing protein n=1 Tax=Boudabousia liubingyangii TaxID=1921764 RepID=A0A1Q5PQ94_9ACTO|nr:FHA domain-containing protein [Boudabousia liubingyangii]OKL49679.1 hypothetical protein BSR29_01625 [Boudabousia liubingyangii]